MTGKKTELEALQQNAEEGKPDSQFELATHYRDGRGTTKNLKKAFAWFRKAALNGNPRAMLALSQCYLHHRGTRSNLREAYIWALLFQTWHGGPDALTFADPLELVLPEEDMLEAQDEASIRHQILCERPLDEADLNVSPNDPPREPKPPAENPAEDPAPASTRKKAPNPFADWEVADIRKLKIDLNPKEKAVLVRYSKRRARLAFGQIFNACDLALMTDFCRHAQDPREPCVAYDSRDFSLSRAFKRKRNNQGVVSDLNHKLRRLLSLDKAVKPFYWFGEKGSRDKILKCSFQIRVHW
jgi:hypothetical protein